MSAFVGSAPPSLAGVKAASLSRPFAADGHQQHRALVCCLVDDGRRCERPACSHVFSKRIEKAVQQRRLTVFPDPTTRHTNICVEHRRQLVPPSGKTTTVVQTRTPPPLYTPSLAHSHKGNNAPLTTVWPQSKLNGLAPPVSASWRGSASPVQQSAGAWSSAALSHYVNGGRAFACESRASPAPSASVSASSSSAAIDVVSDASTGGHAVERCAAGHGHSAGAVAPMRRMVDQPCSSGTSRPANTARGLHNSNAADLPEADWSSLSASTLRRCGRHLKVSTRHGSGRRELAAAVAERAKLIDADQKRVLAYFVYFAKTRRRPGAARKANT